MSTVFNVDTSGNLLTIGTVRHSSLSSAGVVHTNSSGFLSTSLIIGADITNSTITGLKIASDTIANSNLANMAAHTFKGNNTAASASPKDLTIAEMQAELGIGSTTLTATRIGFGSASNLLTGSTNLTWNDTTKVLSLASNSELNLGASNSSNRKFILFNSSSNDYQFYGIGVIGAECRYRVGDPAADHVFFCGLSSTTERELFRIKGNMLVSTVAGGGLQFGNSTASYSPTTLDYYEELTTNFTVGGCWSNRTVSVKLVRIGKVVHMRFGDLTAATVTANSEINGVTDIPARFLPQAAPTGQSGQILVIVNGVTKPGLFLMITPDFIITDSDQTEFDIGQTVGIRASCVTWVCP